MNKTNKGLRDKPRSMPNNKAYSDNYDRIFGKPELTNGMWQAGAGNEDQPFLDRYNTWLDGKKLNKQGKAG